jgi:hypothetical protein
MTEKTTLKAFVLFLFVVSVMALSQAAFAALSMTPTVPGYAGGTFSSPAGGFTMSPANDGFIKPSVVNVGGKPITVPAHLKMAANAGQYAKNAMKLNPWAIAGTLAAGWLLDQGLEWIDGQGWMQSQPIYQYAVSSGLDCPNNWNSSVTGFYTGVNCFAWQGAYTACGGSGVTAQCAPGEPNSGIWYTWNSQAAGAGDPVTADDADWDALPDPLPAIAPELPYAPYMPEGVPVDAPDYYFAPFSVPLGEPYTKPDGSTAQPSAKVSPNGDQVTVDTYDQPLTDPQGNPVPDAPPVDTPEPEKDPCLEHPDRIGCMPAGSDTFPLLQKETHTMVFTPEASPISGGCPASISMPRGHVLSFASACDAMTQIRPIVIALAGVLTAFMVIGVMRS